MITKHQAFNESLRALLERTGLLDEMESEMKRTFSDEWEDYWNAQIYGNEGKSKVSISLLTEDGKVEGIDFQISYPHLDGSYGNKWYSMEFFFDGTCYYAFRRSESYDDYLKSRLDEITHVLNTQFKNPRVYGRD